jgi:hypothetical protein
VPPWAEVAAAARGRALGPWAASRALRAPHPPPAAVEDAVRAVAHAQALLADAALLWGILTSAGLRALPIKGAALLLDGLFAPGERHTEDIDVWIHPEDAAAVEAELQRAGWRLQALPESLLPDGTAIEDGRPLDHHALHPRVAPMGTSVDLHLRSPDRTLSIEDAWSERRTVTLLGQAIPVPDRAHQARILCAHVGPHHGWAPAMWCRHLLDVRALATAANGPPLEAGPAWHGWGMLDALVQGHHGSALQRLAMAWLLPDPGLDAAQTRVHAWSELLRRTLRDARQRPALLRHKVLPTAAWMEEQYGPATDPLARARRHLARWTRVVSRGSGRGERP